MACLRCGQKEYCSGLCRNHFREHAISRIRREIKDKGLIQRGDVFVIKEPFYAYLLKEVMGGMLLDICRTLNAKNRVKVGQGKKVRILSDWSLDDELISFMMGFFGEKKDAGKAEKAAAKTKIIKPFRTLKEDELIMLSRIARMRLRKKKRTAREEELKRAIEKIDKDHPETRYSLLKSIEEIKGIRRCKDASGQYLYNGPAC